MNASSPALRALSLAVAATSLLTMAAVARGQDEGIAGGSSSAYDPANAFSGHGRFGEIPAYFPPSPPVLAAPLPAYNPTIGWPAPPWEVGDYLTDGFYPALSSRLAIDDLPAKLKARVEAYGAKKTRLVGELRDKLDSLKTANAATREKELAAFATTQAAALAELEDEAEALRVDLTAGGLFHESVDWNYTRAWRLNESAFRTMIDGMVARLQVMRAAAYYQDGFSRPQRDLLKEIAMEIADAIDRLPPGAETLDTPPIGSDSNPVFYFSPATSRFRLPAGLPPGVRARISEYESRKSALKSELQEMVAENDSAIFSSTRRRAAEALAKKQQPEFDALEALADDIRRDLAAYPDAFKRPAAPNLPPPLLDRMTAWVRERRVMQDSVFFLVEAIKKVVRLDRISYPKGADGAPAPAGRRSMTIQIAPKDESNQAKITAVRALVDQNSRENRPRAAHLEAERVGIRADVARFFGDPGRGNPAAITAIVDESFDTLDRIEEWAMYTDYRTALFEPGLSPAQRRLMFDSAIHSLNLPLPPEERSLRIMQPE